MSKVSKVSKEKVKPIVQVTTKRDFDSRIIQVIHPVKEKPKKIK